MHGYTQVELARMLGMKTASLISEWESGRIIPGLDNLLKLSVIYHTLIEELYFDRLQKQRSLLGPAFQQARIINQQSLKP